MQGEQFADWSRARACTHDKDLRGVIIVLFLARNIAGARLFVEVTHHKADRLLGAVRLTLFALRAQARWAARHAGRSRRAGPSIDRPAATDDALALHHLLPLNRRFSKVDGEGVPLVAALWKPRELHEDILSGSWFEAVRIAPEHLHASSRVLGTVLAVSGDSGKLDHFEAPRAHQQHVQHVEKPHAHK